MTVDELKESIAKSDNIKFYQDYSLQINYNQINLKLTLNGIIGIYQFICDQAEGFSKIQNLPSELEDIRLLFIHAKSTFLQLYQGGTINKYSWDEGLKIITGENGQFILLYNSPETEILLDLNLNNKRLYAGVFEFVEGSTNNAHNKNRFEGYLYAYELLRKEQLSIQDQKDAKLATIASLQSLYQENVSLLEKKSVEYITNSNKSFEEYTKSIDNLKSEKQSDFNTWFDETTSSFQKFEELSNNKILELENLYKEKLKLEAPATYWKERAEKLRKEGKNWLWGLIVCSLVSIIILLVILSKIADGTIQKVFLDTGTAVKWSIAFITLISFLAYGVRVFSKLTFSSFHLVRDAEEREQLTYVFLALQKEKGIDQTERHLVMQSLFSRADTGLLKDDASPTMPGNIIDQFTKK